MVCPRCGTSNPDGNSFCLACGNPLAAPVPAPAVPVSAVAASPFSSPPAAYTPPPATAAPSAIGPPPAPPQYYQTPYYAPGAGAMQPPVHRTPWLLIIAVVVVLVLLMGGFGTLLAVSLQRANNSSQAGNLSELSSPSPAVSPSPLPKGSPSAPPPVAADSVTVPVPDGWSVVQSDAEEITLMSPKNDGTITIASSEQTPPATAQQNKESIDAFFLQQYPDTKPCAGSKAVNGSLNGVSGISWSLCFTLTSGAQSVPAAASLFVGANQDGSVYYAMYMLTVATNMPNFQKEAAPVIKGIVWNLK